MSLKQRISGCAAGERSANRNGADCETACVARVASQPDQPVRQVCQPFPLSDVGSPPQRDGGGSIA